MKKRWIITVNLLFHVIGDFMKSGKAKIALISLVIISCFLLVPVTAVLQEFVIMGQVTKVYPDTNQINVKRLYEWDGKTWVRSRYPNTYTGTVPDKELFDYIVQGYQVQAASLGDYGGEWVAVGLIANTESEEKPLKDVFGDPSFLPSFLWNGAINVRAFGYKIEFTTNADCNSCDGSTCDAISSDVTAYEKIENKWASFETKTMVPGETYLFDTPSNDQYDILVTFVSGQASSSECSSMAIGPQPVSNFVIHVTQKTVPVTPVETITATPLPTTLPATPTPTPATPAPAATPGFTGFIALTGILGAALFLISRR